VDVIGDNNPNLTRIQGQEEVGFIIPFRYGAGLSANYSNPAFQQLAVVAASTGAEVDFSGIYSQNGGTVDVNISYKNNGTSAVAIGIEVNQFAAGNLSLSTTGAAYSIATV
jgi:hypothetical protein